MVMLAINNRKELLERIIGSSKGIIDWSLFSRQLRLFKSCPVESSVIFTII